uniref:hypothetical protein n=1 Tax=uncultured Gimesia sp. TaxID=1678688 RepID=UPI0026123917
MENDRLLGELISRFRELKDEMQDGEALSHVLLEFVSPDVLDRGFVHFKDCPKGLGDVQTLGQPKDCKDSSKRIYHSKIIPYRGDRQILAGQRGDAALPDKYQTIYTQLKECLNSIGREFLNHPLSKTVPVVITGDDKRALSWLFYLHYFDK